MIICSQCQHTNPHGAIFCLDCGVSLDRDQHGDTQSILHIAATQVQPLDPAPMRPSIVEPVFCATVIATGRRIRLPLAAPLLVGRLDRSRGTQPAIDLSDDGGYDGGVSRQHARILMADGAIYVEDLASANGTFINDRQIAPHTRYAIFPNMHLRFGSVVLRIDHTSFC